MRRLPVYLLLDTSGSMRGEPIEAVNSCIKAMVSALKQDPYALETVNICIMTFDIDAKVVVPLTPVGELQVPHFNVPQSGPTHLGLALKILNQLLGEDVCKSTKEIKGDWAPLVFVMTDGMPSDTQLFQQQCPKIRQFGLASVIGCVAGPRTNKDDLRPLCDCVVSLDTMDSAAFMSFFQWVTTTISSSNKSLGIEKDIKLPPPPAEIRI